MSFDDTYKMFLEELTISFSQLYKYPDYTANVSNQGPSRKGNMPDGFKGDKFGTTSTTIEPDAFPQVKNKTRKEIKKATKKNSNIKKEKALLRNLNRIKKGY
jgi:hypothetical protein